MSNGYSGVRIEAIQAFLVGLSKMCEEGVSAIATLEDIGLSG